MPSNAAVGIAPGIENETVAAGDAGVQDTVRVGRRSVGDAVALAGDGLDGNGRVKLENLVVAMARQLELGFAIGFEIAVRLDGEVVGQDGTDAAGLVCDVLVTGDEVQRTVNLRVSTALPSALTVRSMVGELQGLLKVK